MASIEEARARYGSTSKEIRRYFRDTHNLKLEYEYLIHDDEVAPVAALYGSLQALDDLLTNSKTVPESLTNGRRQKVGDILIMGYDSYGTAGTVQPYGNGTATLTLSPDTSASEASRLLAEGPDYGLRTTVTGTFGLENIVAPNPVFRSEGGRRLDETKLSPNDVALRAQISQRLAYAVAVHEWAHTLDVRQPDPKQRDVQGRYWRSDAIYGDNDGSPFPSRSGYESDAIRTQLRTTAVTDYGTYDRQEFVAEAFAAWFLFARSTSAQGRALGDEARGALKPFLENTPMLKASAGIKIQELPFDHPVILFALAPLMASNPQAFLKGDFVGHPFRGNQWTDASGVSRGVASSGASDGDRFDLRGVATIDEARRTGRPLAMLRPETYSPKVRELVDANTQARDLLGKIITEAEASGDVTAALNDPRWAALETILVLTAAEASRQIALEYALALGFETVPEPPTNRYGSVVSEEFAYEDQSRNEDGRLIRSEETIDANYVVNSGFLVDRLTLSTVILEKSDDGKVTVRFAKHEGESAGVSRSGYEYGDNVDVRTLMGAKFVRATDNTSGLDPDTSASALARSEQGGDLGRELVRQAAQELGITLPTFRPPVHVTAAPLAEKLRAQGESDVSDKIGTMLAHVEDVSRAFAMFSTTLSTDTAGRRTDGDNMKPAMLAEQAANLPPDTKVSVTVPANRVSAILKDGRLKTQFETGTSKGLNLPRVRESAEAHQFGLPQGTDPALRPIYGMMESGGVTLPSSLRDNEQYGTVTLVLKDDVRDRTTFTDGDSLNRRGDPVPASDASKTLSTRDPDSKANFDRTSSRMLRRRSSGYYEAQIYGGVKTSDIDRAIIDTSTYKDYEWTQTAPSPALLKALGKAGIPYEIVQGKRPDATKSAFAPTVLIKGDYVGHPFRGNQWSDSSGVSTQTGQGSVSDLTSSDPDRVITDKQARGIAADLMDKMDIVADAGAVIKIGEPTSEARAVYNDQLETKSLSEQERPQQRTLVLNGINATEAALNDEGTIVVITDRDNQIVGALSMQEKPVFGSSFSELSAFHAMSEVVQPSDKYIHMYAAGSTGRLDGVGSTLFGQAVLNASRQGSGLYLTPLNQTAIEFWEKIGFKTVDAGQEFTKYQYLDAGSVKAIADNLDDPMETP